MSVFVQLPRLIAAVFCALTLLGVAESGFQFEAYTSQSQPFAEKGLGSSSHLSLLQTKADLLNAREASQVSEAAHESQTVSSAEGDSEQSPADLSQVMNGDIVSQLSDLVGDDATSKVKLTSTVVVKPGKNGTNQGDGQESQKTQIMRTLVVKQQQEVTAAPTEEQVKEEKVAAVPKVLASDVAKIASGINRTEFEDKTALKAPELSPEDVRQMRALASMRISANNMVMRLDNLVRDTELARNAFADDGSLKVEQVVPPIGFVKTHRTGSSTIANVIHRLGDVKDLKFLLPASPAHANSLGWPGPFPGKDAAASNGLPKQQYDVICSTAVFNDGRMREYLKPSPFFLTVLRQPVSQIKSAFDFFAPPCEDDWDSRISWLTKLSHGEAQLSDKAGSLRAQFLNPQASDLGWYEHVGFGSEGGAPSADRDDSAVNRWLGGISKTFGFVMLTEFFDEGMVLLRKKLGLEIKDVHYLRMRVGGKHSDLTDKQANKVEDLLPVDTLLYKHFNKTFWQEWEDAGGYELLGDELEELRLRNEVVEEACGEKDEAICMWNFQTDSVEYTEYLKQKQVILSAAK